MVPFVKKNLSDIESMRLIKHTEVCKECKEELKIQFLVREGLKRLETGGNFNLEKDFEGQLYETRRHSRALIWFRRAGYVLDGVLVTAAILFLLVTMVFR